MISKPEGDGSFVTTPLYVGTEEQVQKMMECDHEYTPGDQVHTDGNVCVVIEYCKHCGAARSRHADNEAVLQKYLVPRDSV